MNQPRRMTALKLRIILVSTLFLMVALIAGVFYVGRGQLSKLATDVSHASVDADASANNLTVLKKLQDTLASNKSVVNNANFLTADTLAYNYQNDVLTDLETYGNQTGVNVSGVDFGAAATSGAAGSMTGGSASAPAGTAGAGKIITVSVTLDNPIPYTNLLNFIQAIEENLPKMQISKLDLTRFPSDPTKVSVSSIALQMYGK